MLKIILLIIAFGSCIHSKAETRSAKAKSLLIQTDTMIIKQILSLPLCSFIGKPVDSLLAVLPNTYDLRGFMYARHGYTKGVIQGYGTTKNNNCHIEIYIDSFQYQSFPNRDLTTWNLPLAGKEIISFIRVMKNNTGICLFGCDNPRYRYLD